MVDRRGKPRPPRRICQECGGHYYKWSGIYCDRCIAARDYNDSNGESLRDFRRRVIEGK